MSRWRPFFREIWIKLRQRYPNGFDTGASVNRKGGRPVRFRRIPQLAVKCTKPLQLNGLPVRFYICVGKRRPFLDLTVRGRAVVLLEGDLQKNRLRGRLAPAQIRPRCLRMMFRAMERTQAVAAPLGVCLVGTIEALENVLQVRLEISGPGLDTARRHRPPQRVRVTEISPRARRISGRCPEECLPSAADAAGCPGQ